MMVKLGEIITQIRGVSYKPSDVRAAGDPDAVALLRANNIQEDGLNFDDLIWVDKQKVGAEQYLRLGDILICSSSGSKGLVGKAAIVTSDLSCAFGAFCKVVRTKAEYASYLGQFFRSSRYRKEISASAAGANINNIRNEHIDEMFISMPSANERAGCVAKLGQIDYLIQKINNQSHQLDQLVKSRFVEMFGTIDDNRFGYKECSLQDVCEPIKDGTHQTPEYTDDTAEGYKFLSSKDVTSGMIDWTHLKYIPEYLHRELYARIAPRKGDILLAKNGTTGVAAIVDRDEVFDIYVSLALIRPLSVDTTYLWAAINSTETKRQFDRSLKGIGVPNLHLGEIKKVRILHPPKDKQNRFAAFVSEVDKSKLAVKQSLEKLETLKKSLMQQYFG